MDRKYKEMYGKNPIECPTAAQIRTAADESKEADKVLRELFPDAFKDLLKSGMFFQWEDRGTCTGVMVQALVDKDTLILYDIYTGQLVHGFRKGSTTSDVKYRLQDQVMTTVRGPLILTLNVLR